MIKLWFLIYAASQNDLLVFLVDSYASRFYRYQLNTFVNIMKDYIYQTIEKNLVVLIVYWHQDTVHNSKSENSKFLKTTLASSCKAVAKRPALFYL